MPFVCSLPCPEPRRHHHICYSTPASSFLNLAAGNAIRSEMVAIVQGVPAASLAYHNPNGKLEDYVKDTTLDQSGRGRVDRSSVAAGDSRFRYS